MAGLLDTVDQRTLLVGQNRLELLLFKLETGQLYGINVFKVKEVLPAPKLTQLPSANPCIKGLAHIRDTTMSVIDLSMSIGGAPVENYETAFVIITEYNLSVQAFLVAEVKRIVNLNWEDIHPAPAGSGNQNYLTSVTNLDDAVVEILDVEKILSELQPARDMYNVSEEYEEQVSKIKQKQIRIIVADDSQVARKQVEECLKPMGYEVDMFNDGKKAYDHIKGLIKQGIDINEYYGVVISDIEMPEMDGYTLTSELRNHPETKNLKIILHTSLSGNFNESLVKTVGANNFISKFQPELLVETVNKMLEI